MNYLFRETHYAGLATTNLFDFVWPITIGLWNLRWQVKGFLDTVPNATTEQAHARFVLGSGIHGADVKAMLKQTSWESQQEQIAEIILTNAFAIYEIWAKSVVKHCHVGVSVKEPLAFPGSAREYIAEIASKPSLVMTNGFQPTLKAHKKYFPSQLDNMLLCYRYFKEIRNAQMHNGGTAEQRTEDAYKAFAPVASETILGTKETIEHVPVILGEPVKLKIRGVVGFSDILLRLMVTIDALLAGSEAAEAIATERLSAAKKLIRTLGGKTTNQTRIIKGVCRAAALPEPADIGVVRTFLLTKQFVNL